MKKLLYFVLTLTLAALAAPLATMGWEKEAETEVFQPHIAAVENLPQPTFSGSFDGETTLRVLTGGEVRELSLREYLTGVVAAEMPAGFPEEALKAQAVAARTYTLYKMALYEQGQAPEFHQGAQLCDDPTHCEAYAHLADQAAALWGGSAEVYRQRISAAVKETDGMILVYDNQPIAAAFCAASTEKTESARDVWGTDLPYLVSVDSPGGTDCASYQGTVRMAAADFSAAVLAQWPEADFSLEPATWFRDSHRSEVGSVLDVEVGGVRLTGAEVRRLVGMNSANFKVRVEGDDLVFTTIGCGHGVGMSQYGARYLALDGQTYDQILEHYYPGTQLRLERPAS